MKITILKDVNLEVNLKNEALGKKQLYVAGTVVDKVNECYREKFSLFPEYIKISEDDEKKEAKEVKETKEVEKEVKRG